MERAERTARFSFLLNAVFSVGYFTLGAILSSWWLIALGVYYLLLSTVRFFVIITKKKGVFVTKFAGIMLMLLTAPLIGTVILSVLRDRGHKLHEIIMITMALYAFAKITLAAINYVKARKSAKGVVIALRNISFAHAFVSIFALQRSMLVSFEGMSSSEIRVMNAATGTAVCIIVFLLGLDLIRKKRDE